MTNQEAVKIIKNEIECVMTDCARPMCKDCNFVMETDDILTALDMAISALEAQESSQNVTNGDSISRKAAMDAFSDKDGERLPWDTYNGYAAPHFIRRIIEDLPSAHPEIIRCEDCKYVDTDATCCLVCNREGMGLKPFHVYPDDYCSYAERKDDERSD